MTFSRASPGPRRLGLGVGVAVGRSPAPSSIRITQQPASLPSRLQEHGALRLQDLERVRPELQPEDVALVA